MGCNYSPPEVQPRAVEKAQSVKSDIEASENPMKEMELEKHASLVFADFNDNCWHQINVETSEEIITVSHPYITCVESYSEEDISPNNKVSLLHTLSKGVLEYGEGVEQIEKYACYFINLRTGLLSQGYKDSMCSGEWNDSSHWVVSEEKRYTIPELF